METGAERKTVRVTIFNHTYSLVATDEAGEVEALAHSIDELMTAIAQRAGNVDGNRVAVLACLHLADRLRSMERRLNDMGVTIAAPFITFSFLALSVIPELKITDRGLVDVERFELVSLAVE